MISGSECDLMETILKTAFNKLQSGGLVGTEFIVLLYLPLGGLHHDLQSQCSGKCCSNEPL